RLRTFDPWPRTCYAGTSTRLSSVRSDFLHEAIENRPRILRQEHRRNPDHADAGGRKAPELVADLTGGADERSVLRERLHHAEALRERRAEAVRLAAILGDQQRHIRRTDDRARIAARSAGVLVENRALAGERLGAAPDVPVIGVARGDLQRDTLTAAADHQLGIGSLHGLRGQWRIAQLIEASFEGRLVLRPQRLEHLARLVETRESLGHR